MSEAKGQQHEPSMEEILASIRRIIAEDGDTSAPPEGATAAAPAPKPVEKPAARAAEPEEILELTEVVDEDGEVIGPALVAPPPEPAPAPVVPLPQRAPEPVAAQQRMAEDKIPLDGIVSPAAAAASVAALSQITALSGRSEPRGQSSDIPLGAGHLTLETLVREELRPILKDWLDRNLPDMVERLVKIEIARLVSDVQRR